MKKTMEVIFGYACISQTFPEFKMSNTTTFTYLNTLPMNQRAKYIKQKTHVNLSNLQKLLHKNHERGISAFRIGDNLISFGDLDLYDIEKEHGQELAEIGKVANQYEMYLSYHPSQFYVLNSKTQKVVQNTVKNFNIFSKILSLMQLKNTPVLLTHVGGLKSFNNWQKACDQFCKNFQKLSSDSKKYLAVENDQNSHSIDSCMYIHKKIGIPVVVDHAHYFYNPVKGISLAQAYKMAIPTWKDRVPKIHLCSQSPDKKIHAHGEYILYKDYKQVYDALVQAGTKKIIMMLQVKRKDVALAKLRQEIASMMI